MIVRLLFEMRVKMASTDLPGGINKAEYQVLGYRNYLG